MNDNLCITLESYFLIFQIHKKYVSVFFVFFYKYLASKQ